MPQGELISGALLYRVDRSLEHFLFHLFKLFEQLRALDYLMITLDHRLKIRLLKFNYALFSFFNSPKIRSLRLACEEDALIVCEARLGPILRDCLRFLSVPNKDLEPLDLFDLPNVSLFIELRAFDLQLGLHR